mgnify:CR=1 FL=1
MNILGFEIKVYLSVNGWGSLEISVVSLNVRYGPSPISNTGGSTGMTFFGLRITAESGPSGVSR